MADNLTGLIWLKKANCSNIEVAWTRALTEVKELNTAGTMNNIDCGDTSNEGSHQTEVVWDIPCNHHNWADTPTTYCGAAIYELLNMGYDSKLHGISQRAQTDWRLPNVKEYQSLIDFGQINPVLPNGGSSFTDVQAFYYWSSTSNVPNPTYAWHVDMYFGFGDVTGKSTPGWVWPVRGGK